MRMGAFGHTRALRAQRQHFTQQTLGTFCITLTHTLAPSSLPRVFESFECILPSRAQTFAVLAWVFCAQLVSHFHLCCVDGSL